MNTFSPKTADLLKDQIRNDLPEFTSGDTIKVNVKIQEGNKFRIQVFEGVVIKTQGSGISYSTTVRKVTNGIAVERTFPLNSPIVESVEIVKRGRVRRARIYYIRKLSGKAARIKEILPTKKVKPSVEQATTKKPATKTVKPEVETPTENN